MGVFNMSFMGVLLKKYNKYFIWVYYVCYNHLNLVVCFSNNGHFGLQQ